jgi:RNA polymerase sigma factor (sigma-70 family)
LDTSDAAEVELVLVEARDGSSTAFEAIYRALSPSVASYLRLNGAEDVDDLTNEVFAQLHRALDRFVGDWAAFRSFVFTIAHRRLVDDRRRRRRRPAVVDGPASEPAGVEDIEGDVVGAVSLAAALALVEQLSTDQREVIVMRIVSDLSIEDVAAALDKSPGAIKALQHRALTALRRSFEAEEAPQ